MARLATLHMINTTEGAVHLRPSLRAALRLARDYGDFTSILKGIAEGSVTILSRLFGECGLAGAALASLFRMSDRTLAARIAELQPIAFDLVLDLLGVDPGTEADNRPADRSAKAFSHVEHYEQLFGFATGILKWTPSEAWAASPAEIMAAYTYRVDAFMSPEDRAKKEARERHAALPILDRVRLTFANIGTRSESDAS